MTRTNGLIIAQAPLPPETCPPGFRRFRYDHLGDSQLLKPVGGITRDGGVRLFGMDVYPSSDIPPPMCVVKSRSSRKEHIIPVRDLPPDAEAIRPSCGNSIKKWRRVQIDEEGLHICTKSAYASGGTWCRNCIDSLRIIFENTGPVEGRATHLWLMPMSESVAAMLPPPERENALYLFGTVNTRDYDDPEYGYCNECRQPWHLEREDDHVTYWG